MLVRRKPSIHRIGEIKRVASSRLSLGGHPYGTVNSILSLEDSKKVSKANRVKNIAIIGAGPAGCEAAKTAWFTWTSGYSFREIFDCAGGQLLTGSRMKIKHDLALYIDNLQH